MKQVEINLLERERALLAKRNEEIAGLLVQLAQADLQVAANEEAAARAGQAAQDAARRRGEVRAAVFAARRALEELAVSTARAHGAVVEAGINFVDESFSAMRIMVDEVVADEEVAKQFDLDDAPKPAESNGKAAQAPAG
jgi:uncharacterized protein (DUF2141 family)